VDFSYDGKKKILSNVNLSIQEGQTIAFVGNSGAGKTSICSLIPRFYDIQGGNIFIDGMSIKDITLQSLRNQIGIVQQEVFLFAGTIEENIRFGKQDATMEELWEAARNARLDEFILSQPEGMKTIIGERGVKMSGGQKQRLSIARMFLKNPSILILDEATSALDTENEIAIHEALEKLAEGRTTLIIAHRFSTIQNASRIFVVEEGSIVEEGTHFELLQYKGIYHKLYGMQHKALSA
jgi:ATP-binding cassette subfamily B protein